MSFYRYVFFGFEWVDYFSETECVVVPEWIFDDFCGIFPDAVAVRFDQECIIAYLLIVCIFPELHFKIVFEAGLILSALISVDGR